MPLTPPQDYRKTRFTHRRGTRAAQPAAADVLPGTLYYVTDENILERSDGTNWQSYNDSIIVSAGTTSGRFSSLVLSNSNGISFGLNGSTITGSAAAAGGGLTNINVSAGTTSNLLSAITLSNSNNVSFGLNASTITATVASSLTNINVSAGTTSNNLSAIVFSNSNGVTFGLNGSTITASAAGGGGGGVTLSQFEIFPHITGATVSSPAPASWLFNPFLLVNPISFSNIWNIKSMSAAANAATSAASSGVKSIAYSHGVTIFKRVDYSGNSSQLTTVTTGSMGFSLRYSHTSGSQSLSASWVTDTTGGLSTFSTTSNNSVLVNSFIGNRLFAIPMVTSLSQGEYFIAHRHSTTTGTTNINSTAASFSVIFVAPAINNFLPLGINTQTTFSHMPWGIGFGRASAVTTDNTMAASVAASSGSQAYWYANFVNLRHQ